MVNADGIYPGKNPRVLIIEKEEGDQLGDLGILISN